MLVVGQASAGRHLDQRGEQTGFLVEQQGLGLDTWKLGLFPGQIEHVDKPRGLFRETGVIPGIRRDSYNPDVSSMSVVASLAPI
jgi:hypothetical protein